MKCLSLKKFLFTPLSVVLLLVLCSSSLSLLFGSSPVSAFSLSSSLSYWWVGFAPMNRESWDDYSLRTGWLTPSQDIIFDNTGVYNVPVNLSYCTTAGVTSEMLGKSVTYRVKAPIVLGVDGPSGVDWFTRYNTQPLITSAMFEAGLTSWVPSDGGHPAYDGQVSDVSISDWKVYVSGDFGSIEGYVNFTLSYPKGIDVPSGLNYICYRLNGNNNTNGGKGFAKADSFSFYNDGNAIASISGINSPHKQVTIDVTLGDVVLDPDKISESLDNLTDQVTGAIKGTTDAIDKNTEAVDKNTEAIDKQTEAIDNQTELIVGAIKDNQQAEKDEQNQREEQGKEDADKAKDVFRFDLFNPFSPIFEMFNPGGCVQIPTIASWLHVEDPQVCPWFPTEVRSVLTPVFSISSIMVLFGFVVKWLRSGDGFVI